MQLFAGNDQVDIAATLYCRIFEFLEKAMSWYTKSKAKTFINSFKEDAYEEFESDIIEIRRLSDNAMRRAQQSAHVENRTTNLMVEATRQDSRETRQDVREIKQILTLFQQNLTKNATGWKDLFTCSCQSSLRRNAHRLRSRVRET